MEVDASDYTRIYIGEKLLYFVVVTYFTSAQITVIKTREHSFIFDL